MVPLEDDPDPADRLVLDVVVEVAGEDVPEQRDRLPHLALGQPRVQDRPGAQFN